MSRNPKIVVCFEKWCLYAGKKQMTPSEHKGHTHIEMDSENDRTDSGNSLNRILDHVTVKKEHPRRNRIRDLIER